MSTKSNQLLIVSCKTALKFAHLVQCFPLFLQGLRHRNDQGHQSLRGWKVHHSSTSHDGSCDKCLYTLFLAFASHDQELIDFCVHIFHCNIIYFVCVFHFIIQIMSYFYTHSFISSTTLAFKLLRTPLLILFLKYDMHRSGQVKTATLLLGKQQEHNRIKIVK